MSGEAAGLAELGLGVKVGVPGGELPANVEDGFPDVQGPAWRLHFPRLPGLVSVP